MNVSPTSSPKHSLSDEEENGHLLKIPRTARTKRSMVADIIAQNDRLLTLIAEMKAQHEAAMMKMQSELQSWKDRATSLESRSVIPQPPVPVAPQQTPSSTNNRGSQQALRDVISSPGELNDPFHVERNYIQLGQSALGRNDLILAQQMFEKASKIELPPNIRHISQRYEAIIGLGKVAEKQGNFALAKQKYQEAQEAQKITRLGRHDAATLTLADFALRQGDLSLAYEMYYRVHIGSPRNTEANLGLGYVALKQGDFLLSERMFGNAFRVSPKNYNVNIALGDLAYEQGNFELAQQMYEEARQNNETRKLNLKDARPYCRLGNVALKLGNRLRAQQMFERARKINPNVVIPPAAAQALQEEETEAATPKSSNKEVTSLKPPQVLQPPPPPNSSRLPIKEEPTELE